MSADYYKNVFNEVSTMHNINTRHSANQNLLIPKRNTEYFKNALCYDGIKLWNNLPVYLRKINNLTSFKLLLKKHLLSCAL